MSFILYDFSREWLKCDFMFESFKHALDGGFQYENVNNEIYPLVGIVQVFLVQCMNFPNDQVYTITKWS